MMFRRWTASLWVPLLATALLSGAAHAPPAAGAVDAPIRLVVDLSERTLTVLHDGEVEETFAVAVGKRGHSTPTGTFRINRVVWDPAWVPPNEEWAEDRERKGPGDPDNPMQGAKLFFRYPDYYIHGTNAPESIGTRASHGCIRMRKGDVERLARLVQEHGGASRSGDWYERVIAQDSRSTPVSLPRPVTLTIRA